MTLDLCKLLYGVLWGEREKRARKRARESERLRNLNVLSHLCVTMQRCISSHLQEVGWCGWVGFWLGVCIVMCTPELLTVAITNLRSRGEDYMKT